MNIPVGRWPERDILDAWWRREDLMILLWSIKRVSKLPPADEQLDFEELLMASGLLKETGQLRRTAKIREKREITQARDVAEFWLWRARTTQLQHSEERFTDARISPEKLQFIIQESARAGERDGLFKCIRGDFPCFGKTFSELDDDEWSLIHSISIERLYALNWLCYGGEWDEVETDT
jgi:Domain of unknown function (DUF4272)